MAQKYQRFLKQQGSIVRVSPNMGTIHLAVSTIAAALYLLGQRRTNYISNPSQLIVPGLLLLAFFMWINNGAANENIHYVSQWWMTLQHIVLGGAVVVAGVQLAESTLLQQTEESDK